MKKYLIACLLTIYPIFSSKEAINNNEIIYLPEIIVSPVDYEQVILTKLWELNVSIDFSYILLAQAKHETGNFTSIIFIENNNFFGMKQPRIRKTLATGTNRAHATYNSIEDSIIDFVYYMEARKIPFHETSVTRYVNLLKKKAYFEDNEENYKKAVRKHKNQINS